MRLHSGIRTCRQGPPQPRVMTRLYCRCRSVSAAWLAFTIRSTCGSALSGITGIGNVSALMSTPQASKNLRSSDARHLSNVRSSICAARGTLSSGKRLTPWEAEQTG